MSEFTTHRRVEFADTDMGGICHFSRFFVFMETAEHRFLDSLGTAVDTQRDGRRISWPRVAASCEYKSPARFGDELEIRVRVRRRGTKSMTYEFSFRGGGREIAAGTMTSVCCEIAQSGELRPIPIPDFVAERLDAG